MTKEVFIQQFEKEFTVYEQVQLIKKYISELNIPTDVDYLPKKTLSISISDEHLAQVFIDNNIKSCLLNNHYVVGRIYTPKGATTNESYVFYIYDLQTGSIRAVSKIIRGTDISYDNSVTWYLTKSENTSTESGLLQWSRRSEYDGDLSFEITLRDLDSNNISGELLIGNYVAYMTNHYWTIGLDDDTLSITCDVEGGMGIVGRTYQTDTNMKMYAGNNSIEVDSDEGYLFNGRQFKLKYKHTIPLVITGTGITGGSAFSSDLSIILILDTATEMTSETLCDYLNNLPIKDFSTLTIEMINTGNGLSFAKLDCNNYGSKDWVCHNQYITPSNNEVTTSTANIFSERISLGNTLYSGGNKYISVRGSSKIEPILVSNEISG